MRAVDVTESAGEMPVRKDRKKLIGVIDDGTKTVRFVIYESERADELASYQLDKTEVQPQEGWSEQDPLEIIEKVKICAQKAIDQLEELGYSKDDIATLGLTNQRETTIAWDMCTGEPLHPAIAWNDTRTHSTVDKILAKVPDHNKNYVKNIAGLPISPYFSALKMKWLLDNDKEVRRARDEKRLMFGTVDSWIMWNLTGGVEHGIHITDVSNASRTLLMNLDTLNWDPVLLRLFGINRDWLPKIVTSSEEYGVVKDGSAVDGILLSGMLGNQQASLVGQNCVQAGLAKNTYRSGCFLLYNTGTKRVHSTHGLLTTVAYKLGPDSPCVYALEGSIAIAGGALKFLRDNLKLIKDTKETEAVAAQVFSTGDVYFVPAFGGLYAPYWRKDARGIICGLTGFTTKNHIIRAALEAVCFQTRDILEAMHKDCEVPLSKLHVDGKMSSNDILMQLQADLIGIPVLRAHTWDMCALGAAVVAGHCIGAWDAYNWHRKASVLGTFLPTTTEEDRNTRYCKWKMAVQRSLGWATSIKSLNMTGQKRFSIIRDVPITPPASRKNSASERQNSSVERQNSSVERQHISVERLTSSFERQNSSVERLTSSFGRRNSSVEHQTSFYDRQNSVERHDLIKNSMLQRSDTEGHFVEDLKQYSARKFSLLLPFRTPKVEKTILDDAEYFLNKNDCDFGMCQCCSEKKTSTNWESIEEIIENDPEIIFDSEDNPILVESNRVPDEPAEGSLASLTKKMHLDKLPEVFKTICSKFSHSSPT